jgi:hypothetical protein
MFKRICDILLRPKYTWPQIKNDATGIVEVLTGYVLILSAIYPICGVIGLTLGRKIAEPDTGVYGIPFRFVLIGAAIWYALVLVVFYVAALIINALAPSFGSKQNIVNAYKLVVYSATPLFVAGILNIIPALGILVFLFSLYGFYLLYVGMPVMLETPREKQLGSFAATLIIMTVLFLCARWISGAVMTAMWRPVLW